MKFRKKPVEVEAIQWWKNGDHPDDLVGVAVADPIGGGTYERVEGVVVRFFRRPDVDGAAVHERCGRTWHDHGWIDQGWIDGPDGAPVVCPGDWVVTERPGLYRSYHADVFEETYRPVPGRGDPHTITIEQVRELIAGLGIEPDTKQLRSIHIDSDGATVVRKRVDENGFNYAVGNDVATETVTIRLVH